MREIVQTRTFSRWFRRLSDRIAVQAIEDRLQRAQMGDLGDTRALGRGLWEMRIHRRPGYRLYYMREGARLIILLAGGTKDGQSRDIARARRLAEEFGG